MLETFCMFLAPRLERSRTRTSSYAIKILPARSISEISLPRRDLCGPQPAPGALSSHVLPMPSSSLRSSPALVRGAAFDTPGSGVAQPTAGALPKRCSTQGWPGPFGKAVAFTAPHQTQAFLVGALEACQVLNPHGVPWVHPASLFPTYKCHGVPLHSTAGTTGTGRHYLQHHSPLLRL